MKIYNIVFFLIFFSLGIYAKEQNKFFDKATSLYRNGKYESAIKIYDSIEKSGNFSSELYYNLGNCYYKLNKVAQTIYYYESALRINPNNNDAKNNLIFAKRLTIDRIEPLPLSIFEQFNKNVLQIFHYDTWAIFSLLILFLSVIFFLRYYFVVTASKKRLFFSLMIVSLLLFIIFLATSLYQYSYSNNFIEAIVFDKKVEIKNEPIPDSNTVFTLHEGTKVQVIDQVDVWKKIKLKDGKIGWIYAKTIKQIKN